MNDDAELLRTYLETRSEDAFTELVHRHIGLVYSTALRRVGHDAHLAEDVTQTVFIGLARKAPSLRDRIALSGWLYVSARMAGAEIVRQERRRKLREDIAQSMHLTDSPSETDIELAQIRPVLDDVIVELKSVEREAIVLRFFEKHSFAEIGAALRVSEEAARKRVDRALEKLQTSLARRGITSTAVALGSALTSAATGAVPIGLADKIASAAIVHGAAAASASIAMTVAAHLLPVAAALAIGASIILPQHLSNQTRAGEIARLSAENAVIPTLRSENLRLSRAVAGAQDLERTAAESPTLRAALAALPSPAPITASNAATVTPEGTILWQGKGVTLDQYLASIRALHASATNGESQLTIHADGAGYFQMMWTLDEARKAGIKHILVESDSTPDPKSPYSWF